MASQFFLPWTKDNDLFTRKSYKQKSGLKRHYKSAASCAHTTSSSPLSVWLCVRGKEAKMHSSHLLLEEPIRMVSILEPSKAVSNFFFFFFFVLLLLLFFDVLFSFLLLVCFLNLFCVFRVSFPQWQRLLERSVPNLDRSRLFLLVLKLECQVCIFLLFALLLF